MGRIAVTQRSAFDRATARPAILRELVRANGAYAVRQLAQRRKSTWSTIQGLAPFPIGIGGIPDSRLRRFDTSRH